MLSIRTASHTLKDQCPWMAVPVVYRPLSTLAQTVIPPIIPAQYHQRRSASSYGSGGASIFANGSGGPPNTYFRRERLPANTIIRFVPQQQAWLVERMGKFHRILEPGLAILIPILDKVQYVKSLKEVAIEIPSQSAITADNVTLDLDGILYIRIFDAYKASYGVEDAEYAISQLAQTTMRSEIGQLTLDHVLKERAALNVNITKAINEAAEDWGVKCLRYEIRDIHAPEPVLQAMHRQVSAERSKRAEILDSEGHRQSAINIAEGKKISVILASEARKAQQINAALGEAESIRLKAEATALGINAVAKTLKENKAAGQGAVSLSVAERYVDAFGMLAKQTNSIIIPAQLGDLGGMIASAMGIYGKVSDTQAKTQQQLGQQLEADENQPQDDTPKGADKVASQIISQFDQFDKSANEGKS